MTIAALGDAAVVLDLGRAHDAPTPGSIRALMDSLTRHPPPGTIEAVPAFATVTLFYDPMHAGGFDRICEDLMSRVAACETAAPFETGRMMEIPVCYGGDYGPDLGIVAAHAGLGPDEVIAQHSGAEYRVQAIGFVPGFPYLSGLAPRLHTSRRSTPRTRVAAGSVGIGGEQTGIYPLATPGGWNLIGRTPLVLFQPHEASPTLLLAGDRVRFKPVSAAEFVSLTAARESGGRADGPTSEENAPAAKHGLIRVIHPGRLTTVQDTGRTGHRAQGVPLSGAVDVFALRLANLLVGNPEDAAALECTLEGPELLFETDALVAVGGAAFDKVPSWSPQVVRAGERLSLGRCLSGCRGYIAVGGGIRVPSVLGSRSTYLAAELGGLNGAPLKAGDMIPFGSPAHALTPGHWSIDSRMLPSYSRSATLRVVCGSHAEEFGESWLNSSFKVTPQLDRMGIRLGGTKLSSAGNGEPGSGVVAPGTIQVPPDGAPIILLADAQTIGGYRRLAHVIAVDLPVAAQLRAGDTVRFQEVSLSQAHRLLLDREHAVGLLREGLAQKFR